MLLLVLLGCLVCGSVSAGQGELRFDFESGDQQGWRVVDGSFGKWISDREWEHNRKTVPYPKEGRWFLSTLERLDGRPDDQFEGVIESPVIRLTGDSVSLRVGGGAGEEVSFSVCALDGTLLGSARGENAERMVARKIFVSNPQRDRLVFFRVTDRSRKGWGHITVDAVACLGSVDATGTVERDKMQKRARMAGRILSARKAMEELKERFSSYPADQMLTRLERCEDDVQLDALLVEALVRRNPLVNAHPILYVRRPQFAPDHHNTATIFQCGEINQNSYRTQGALCALDVKTGQVRTIVEEKPGRTIRDPEVHFSGASVIFSMREGKEGDYHIWTVQTDGSALCQLTFSKGVSDIDPIWLPDGDIVYSSTREPKYCMCNRHIMCNLFRMKGNGANSFQMGKSTLFEGHSALLSDGRILYDRWEYVDRNFGDAQGLWVCNPDGTGHALFWGNNTTSPGGVIQARPLPRSSVVLSVMAACHDRPWGALALIDRSKGVEGQIPVLRTWPSSYREQIHTKGENFDSPKRIRRKYANPFALDESHFLCVRQVGNGMEETGLVYLDLFGNEVMFHRDGPGCHDPMPIRVTEPPPIRPLRRSFEDPKAPGWFYLQNVMIGTHMKGVKPGTIKYLRVVESPEKRSWTGSVGWFGHGEEAAAMNWHSFENKRILGTVPVEPDGSAYFEVPGNTFVYFQALDAEGKMVQSMRSGAYVQPGETYGCVGCHENRVGDVPPTSTRPIAMGRKPNRLNGWYGPPRLFSYQREVQPVFTRHCVGCHDLGKPAGEKVNLTGGRDLYFAASYVDLWALGVICEAGGGPAEILPAYSWGSHASRLTKRLYGHGRVALTPEERDRILTWMDLNAVYYPCYESAYPNHPGGRSPLTREEVKKIETLSGVRIQNRHNARQRAQINFDQPEKSRILAGLRSPEKKEVYGEILTLIRIGAERLRTKPRADMEGFVPCAVDQQREARYQRRLEEERAVYQAIREGRDRFDPR